MNIKTSRPLPPTPTSATPSMTPPSSPQVTPQPPKPATKSGVAPSAVPSSEAPALAGPEENQRIAQSIEQSNPSSLQTNASKIPLISPMMPPGGVPNPQLVHQTHQKISKYQETAQQTLNINLKMQNLSQEILQLLPPSEQNDFSKQVQLETQQHQAEFNRQMHFSSVLRIPGQGQIAARQDLASQNHQARFQEAQEVLDLQLVQAGDNPSKISAAYDEFNQQKSIANALLKAEILNGDGINALLQGTPHVDKQRQAMANLRSENIQNHFQESTNLHMQKQELELEIRNLHTTVATQKETLERLKADVSRYKEPYACQKEKVENIQTDIQGVDTQIEMLKQDPKMSSLKLKALMITKDQLQNTLAHEKQILEPLSQDFESKQTALNQKGPQLETEIQASEPQLESLQNKIKIIDLKTQKIKLAIQKEHLLIQADMILATP